MILHDDVELLLHEGHGGQTNHQENQQQGQGETETKDEAIFDVSRVHRKPVNSIVRLL